MEGDVVRSVGKDEVLPLGELVFQEGCDPVCDESLSGGVQVAEGVPEDVEVDDMDVESPLVNSHW